MAFIAEKAKGFTMDLREPTEEEVALFNFGFSNNYEVGWDVGDLYHYRSSETVLNGIIQEKNIQLRLTYAENFPDKFEGKAIEVFYDIALEELARDGLLNKEQYATFTKVDLFDKKLFFTEEKDEISHYAMKKYEAYILCFSTVKDDPYMFEEYGNHSKDKFCLAFSGLELRELSREDNGYPIIIKLVPVLYGKQVVEHLKVKIQEIADNQFYYKNAGVLISDILTELQYAAKLHKYYKENEIRLVVYLPKDEGVSSKHFEKYIEDGKQYLGLKLEKLALLDISAAPWNKPDTIRKINSLLKQYNYDVKLAKEQ